MRVHKWLQAHNKCVSAVLHTKMQIALDNKARAVHHSYTWFFNRQETYCQVFSKLYFITGKPQSEYHLSEKKTKTKCWRSTTAYISSKKGAR